MTKQTITTEIDIPDGCEFVRFGRANPGEYVLHSSGGVEEWTTKHHSTFSYIIIRPVWQPPSWMRPGWIVSSRCLARWYWHKSEPVLLDERYLRVDDFTCCVYANGKPTIGDFTPPPCDDWRQSKRRVRGAE